MNPFLSFIRLLSDPTIALAAVLHRLGGLLAELYSPNFVTGILGALMILLALIGLGHPAAQRRRAAADPVRHRSCSGWS